MENPLRQDWFTHLHEVEGFYNYLIANGVPAEDARGVLPHVTTTRLHYHTNLRNLSEHAGNRLCTQAQFVWRDVFTQIRDFVIEKEPLLAELDLFKPVCYQMGKCPFKADFDRGCTIRERVDAGKWDEINPMEWQYDPKAAWL